MIGDPRRGGDRREPPAPGELGSDFGVPTGQDHCSRRQGNVGPQGHGGGDEHHDREGRGDRGSIEPGGRRVVNDEPGPTPVDRDADHHRRGQGKDDGEADLHDVSYPGNLLQEPPRHPVAVPRVERKHGGDYPDTSKEEQPTIVAPDDGTHYGDSEHTHTEVTKPGEPRPLVAAEPDHVGPELTEAPYGPKASECVPELGERAGGPDRAGEMCGTPEEEPEGISQDKRRPDQAR